MRIRMHRWILLSLAFAAQTVAQEMKTGLSPVLGAVTAESDTEGRPAQIGAGSRAGRRSSAHLRPGGSVRTIDGSRRRVYPGRPHQAARAFLRDNPDLIANTDPEQLQEL